MSDVALTQMLTFQFYEIIIIITTAAATTKTTPIIIMVIVMVMASSNNEYHQLINTNQTTQNAYILGNTSFQDLLRWNLSL